MRDSGIEQKNILFQRLGTTWYAFLEEEGETVFYTPLPEHLDPRYDKFEIYKIVEEIWEEEQKFVA